MRLVNDAGIDHADGDGYYIRNGIIIVPKGARGEGAALPYLRPELSYASSAFTRRPVSCAAAVSYDARPARHGQCAGRAQQARFVADLGTLGDLKRVSQLVPHERDHSFDRGWPLTWMRR